MDLGAIGKIERIPLRDVWHHEALDFTKWLRDNIDVLSDAIGVNLASPESEQAAGDFSVDIVATDEAGDPVVVENQLDRSDHDHLGKVVTYLAAYGAKKAVWIVAEPRPEHVGAVNWLNESSGADFYLLKVDAIRIGDSVPAPLLTLIVGPSAEIRRVQATKSDLAEQGQVLLRYWTGLLDKARQKTKLHASVSPQQNTWIGATAGVRGFSWNYSVIRHRAQVELYIDRGKGADKENIQLFEALEAAKDDIEAAFGGPLSWERLEGKRACRIAKRLEGAGYLDEDQWPDLQEAMVEAMIAMERALRPFLSKVPP